MLCRTYISGLSGVFDNKEYDETNEDVADEYFDFMVPNDMNDDDIHYMGCGYAFRHDNCPHLGSYVVTKLVGELWIDLKWET